MQTADDMATIYQRPADLLRTLIRFDTTNPPGNELACVTYIRDLLGAAGIESRLIALDPNRPNLIARLPGRGEAPPLLLYGHVDVVTTAGQDWSHPPLEGVEADGMIWGRGALDMKGGIAMMLAAFLRAKIEGASLPGDVVLAILSDEEDWGAYGARFLVEQHAEQFAGIRHAIGEFGGFSFTIGPRVFYPIMVAEKQGAHVRATLRGPAGHGSMPARGGTAAKLARFLIQLDRRRLPVHITPVSAALIATVADALPAPNGPILRQLLNPRFTNRVLDLLGARGSAFDPLLHNTVAATIIRGGEKGNVLPSEITVDLDCRLLPGFTTETLLGELRGVVGRDVELEVVAFDANPADKPNMALFDTLAGILHEIDPEGIPTPYLLSGITDGRFFSRLGIQTYGFLPMRLPADLPFSNLIHAADERIPADAPAFGANAIFQALQRFGAAS